MSDTQTTTESIMKYTDDNTEGYTQPELDRLNELLEEAEWDGMTDDDAQWLSERILREYDSGLI